VHQVSNGTRLFRGAWGAVVWRMVSSASLSNSGAQRMCACANALTHEGLLLLIYTPQD
jgi:hypothetical protein